MFDIQTEIHLRRTHPRAEPSRTAPIVPLAIATSVVLWSGVLLSVI